MLLTNHHQDGLPGGEVVCFCDPQRKKQTRDQSHNKKYNTGRVQAVYPLHLINHGISSERYNSH